MNFLTEFNNIYQYVLTKTMTIPILERIVMPTKEMKVPELSVIFLIPIKIAEIDKGTIDLEKIIRRFKKQSNKIEDNVIPIEIKEEDYVDLSEDLKIFYDSDIEFFDETYLELKRFVRIDLCDFTLSLVKNGKKRKVTVKPYLTVFEVGIAVYTFWIVGLKDLTKSDVIDLCFLNKAQIKTESGQTTTVLSFIKQELREIIDPELKLVDQEIIENHLTMLFIKDFHCEVECLPDDFVNIYKNELFDLLCLPERYYGTTYDFHASRTTGYVDKILENISVRNDFPVFLFDNRFLGIKIRTEKPDYGFNKRVIFNVVLYTNVIFQLMLIKEINDALSNITEQLKKVTLGRVIKLRQSIYRNLEEYINTTIQRIEIWKMAMHDASKQLKVPELFSAVKERLNMLDSYLGTTFQRQTNVLFVILNTIFFLGTLLAFIEFFLAGEIQLVKFIWFVSIAILCSALIIVYYRRFFR